MEMLNKGWMFAPAPVEGVIRRVGVQKVCALAAVASTFLRYLISGTCIF